MLPETKNFYYFQFEGLALDHQRDHLTDTIDVMSHLEPLEVQDIPREEPSLLLDKERSISDKMHSNEPLNQPHNPYLEISTQAFMIRGENILENYVGGSPFEITFPPRGKEDCFLDTSNVPFVDSKEEMKINSVSSLALNLPEKRIKDISAQVRSLNNSSAKLTYCWPKEESVLSCFVSVSKLEPFLQKIVGSWKPCDSFIEISCTLTRNFSFSLQIIDSSLEPLNWNSLPDVADSNIFHNIPKTVLEKFLRKKYIEKQRVNENVKENLRMLANDASDLGKFESDERAKIDEEYPEIIEYFRERIDNEIQSYYASTYEKTLDAMQKYAKSLQELPDKFEAKFPTNKPVLLKNTFASIYRTKLSELRSLDQKARSELLQNIAEQVVTECLGFKFIWFIGCHEIVKNLVLNLVRQRLCKLKAISQEVEESPCNEFEPLVSKKLNWDNKF